MDEKTIVLELLKAFVTYLFRNNKITNLNQAPNTTNGNKESSISQVLLEIGKLNENQLRKHLHQFKKDIEQGTTVKEPKRRKSKKRKKEDILKQEDLPKEILAAFEQIKWHSSFFQAKEEKKEGEKKQAANATKDLSAISLENSDFYFKNLRAEERYSVIDVLGEGGMGKVEEVEDSTLGRKIALKTIKRNKLLSNRVTDKERNLWHRLQREASITAKLEHPNIVPLYDMGSKKNGDIFFTMRKVEGNTFGQILKDAKKNPTRANEEKILAIFLKICDAVAYAHNRGYIHRDLKPANIMVGEFGEVYVMDWGIAKSLEKKEKEENLEGFDSLVLTQGGIGTLGYMPPEQEDNSIPLSFQSDIYALGKILRECFTYLSPMEEFQEILIQNRNIKQEKQQREFKVRDLEEKIPADIKAIFKKATKEESFERYKKVQDLKEDIERYLQHHRVSAKEYHTLEIMKKWLWRNKEKVAVISAAVVLVISLSFYFSWKRDREIYLEKENKFSTARQEVAEQKNVFKEIKGESKQEQGKKMLSLLYALLSLNVALEVKPQENEIEKEKKEICEKGIQLCIETKEFQFANYFAKEMQRLSILSDSIKRNVEKEVTLAQTKTLRDNLTRLDYWIEKLKSPDAGEDELALLEISKMQEKEVFNKLIDILNESCKYYVEEKTKTVSKRMYYITIVRAIGRLENPEAGPFLLSKLQKIYKKIFKIHPKDRDSGDIDYMVALTNSLGYSKTLNGAEILREIRSNMGEYGDFWERTNSVYKRLETIDGLAKRISQTAENFYRRGATKSRKKDYQGAIEDFTLAIKKQPNMARAYNGRGSVKLSQGKTKEAIKDFNKAIEIEPDFVWPYNNRGEAFCRKKNYNKALKDFSQAMVIAPHYLNSYLNRGNLHFDLKRWNSALKDYNKVIELNPRFPIAYLNRGLLFYSGRKYKEALKDFDKAIELNPRFTQALNSRGHLNVALKKYEEAINDYNESIRCNPKRARTFYYRANAKQRRKKFKESLEDYNEAIRLNPNFIQSYEKKGKLNFQIKNYKEALRDFTKVIDLKPNSAYAYYDRGNAYIGSKNFENALKDFSQSITLKADFAEAYERRAYVKGALNDIEGAISDYQQATTINPKFSEAYFSLGKCYQLFMKAEEDKAVESFILGLKHLFKLEIFAEVIKLIRKGFDKNKDKKKAKKILYLLKNLIPSNKSELHKKVEKELKKYETK